MTGLVSLGQAKSLGVQTMLFGENRTLRHLLEDGLNFRKDMMRTKEEYLNAYEAQFKRTALEAQLSAQRALDTKRNGFETGVAWHLFENGYLGAKSLAVRKRVQKGIAFEHDVDTVLSNYAEVAYYEIEDIKRTILYKYAQRRVELMKRGVTKARHKLHAGLLTRLAYERIETAYKKSQKTLEYLFVPTLKPFDDKYFNLISHIEKKRLIDVEKLKRLTLKNAPSVKIEKEKLAEALLDDDWKNHLKGELYLERKEYTFVDRRETLGGLQLRIPLDRYGKNAELKRLERAYSRQKLKSIKLILEKRVAYLYSRIGFAREQIDRLKKEHRLSLHQLQQYRYKAGHPSGEKERDNSWEKRLMIEKSLLDTEQNVWLQRADILSALLKLQYLSGVRLLR